MRTIFAVIWFAMLATSANAQDFKVGLDAYDRNDFEAALAVWQPLAEQGDARAQFNLGVLYFNGQGVSYDPGEAVEWYRAAADQGYGPAQANLALMYETGQGLLQNYVEAYKWVTLAEIHGVAGARKAREGLAAKMTAAQISGAKLAAAEWRPIIAETSPPGPAGVSATHAASPAPPQAASPEPTQAASPEPTQVQISDTQRALNALGFDAGPPDGIAGPRTRAAIRGYQNQAGLPVTGVVNEELIGRLAASEVGDKPVPADEQVAARVTEEEPAPPPSAPAAEDRPVKAADCDQGAAHPADTFLPPDVAGVSFDEIDPDRAIAACELALAHYVGVARYQFQLGRSLHRAERFEEAATYYRQAGLQGHVLAQKSLGFTYSNGLGVTQNYVKAAERHQMAADQGDADAQQNLGYLYAGGRGVDPDIVEAHMWYSIAAAHNSQGAADKRELLAGRMTNGQIEEAEQRALAWFERHPGSAGSR